MPSLSLPSGLENGVSELGIKFQSGPESITRMNNKPIALEIRVRTELGILSSSARLESYQTFATSERCVNILIGEKIIRTPPAKIWRPDVLRKRRPEVRTGCQSTANRPSRFSLRANEPSSPQKRRSLNPPVAKNASRVENMNAPPVKPMRLATGTDSINAGHI